MRALFSHCAVGKDDNVIGVRNGLQSMSDKDAGALLEQQDGVDVSHHLVLGVGVQS